MKQKFMRLFTGIAIVTTICIGFSSFVGDGEDDGVQKKKETLILIMQLLIQASILTLRVQFATL